MCYNQSSRLGKYFFIFYFKYYIIIKDILNILRGKVL